MNLERFLKDKFSDGLKTALLGVGSVLRSDDAVGMDIIERLSGLLGEAPESVLLIAGSTAPENFTGVIRDFTPGRLFIIDAAQMGLPPGEIRVLDETAIGGVQFSTHMLPLPLMLSYLVPETGCEVICIGIQPESTQFGFEMSAKAAQAAERLAGYFCDAIRGN